MLTYAWNNTKEKDIALSSGEESPELYNFLAQKLVDGIYHLIKRGFNRDYRMLSNDLKAIRGKINFTETIKRGLLYNGKVQCEYDEFDEDTKQKIMGKHNITHLKQLPLILKSDPITKYYNLKSGDVFKVIRHSKTSGVSTLYRYVK